MSFRLTGLSLEPFKPFFAQPDEVLAQAGIVRVPVTAPSSAPCRITLDDAEPGETVLLMNWEHQPEETPFRSRHAIYVREAATRTFDEIGVVPAALRRRPLSVRAFDAAHMMIDADLTQGAQLERLLVPYLARDEVAYVHIHYAKRGCFAARAERG